MAQNAVSPRAGKFKKHFLDRFDKPLLTCATRQERRSLISLRDALEAAVRLIATRDNASPNSVGLVLVHQYYEFRIP